MSGKTKDVETTITVQADQPQVTVPVTSAVVLEPVNNPSPGATGVQTLATGRMFTQVELDGIIAGRLDQERRKYADYETIRQQLTALQAGQSTQAQQVQQLEQQNQVLTVVSKEKAIEAAVAKAAGVIGLDPDAAMKLADLKTLTVDEAGNVTNAADVVKSVAERFPGLLKRPMPVANAVNPPASAGLTLEQREAQYRQEFFGGGARGFFSGGGVILPSDLSS